MLSTYLKVAFRIFWRNKIYVVVNLLGLSFAMACCMLAFLNYQYRAGFDQNHTHTDPIYRVNSLRKVDGGLQPWGVVPMPLAQAMLNDLAAVKRMARLKSATVVVKQGGHTFGERLHFADKTLFEFFNFPLKYGTLSGFERPNQVIISETFAEKYFPQEIPIGKPLRVIGSGGDETVYTIGAVAQKIPANSSIQFDLITSFGSGQAGGPNNTNWASPQPITAFVEVKDQRTALHLTASLQSYAALHNRNQPNGLVENFYLQPFQEIATSSDVDMPGYVHGGQLTTNPRGVLVLVPAVMSLFILLITCFNFTNISIAFASGRLKEIGIRKAIGGVKNQLIRQFLTENVVLCLVASALAVLMVSVFLPLLYQVTLVDLRPALSQSYSTWLFLLLMPLVSAVFSGLYPAVYISSFEPVRILKGKTSFGSSNRFTRMLLVAQFSLSCFALIVGIVMTQNASFQQQADFGYAIKEVAVVEVNSRQQYTALSQAAGQHPAVKSLAGTAQQIGDGSYPVTARFQDQQIQAQVSHVGGEAYLNCMGIRLLQGRHFYQSKADTDESILVNQTFLKQLHLTQPLGQRIQLDTVTYTIVGVINDYKEYGLHGLVPPCVLRLAQPEDYKYMVIRTSEKERSGVVKYLQEAWRKVAPNVPYQGYLQTDLMEKEVRLTQGFKSVAFFLAMVTLLLSASGLFALVSLHIDKRSKEIGVRKVLGASVLQIVVLVNRTFIRILLIAFGIGSALGYLFTDKLVFQFIFKYHPEVGLTPYIATLLTVLSCCGLIIGMKVYKAATVNPVKSLAIE
ncbi:ABC transporter permease [Larkinella soli]|uniref:ABC transporter permease n=1 Tax=Larkinella soli TaxID=1770527 RepID=UPI000FFC91C6|nr:ABC transporter permease [Larkinella soli]